MLGRHFTLTSVDRASLDVGSPVYYRQIRVGKVVDYSFSEDRESVNIKIFIHAPHHENVRKNTRFWNAGGVDVKLDADGITVGTQSLTSILLGGLAFDVPHFLPPGDDAPDGSQFVLYRDRRSIEERIYTEREYYLMYFDQKIRGLSAGAPVEFRGIKLGEVVDVKLEFDLSDVSIRTPVLVMIEPERIDTVIGKDGSRLTAEQKAAEVSKKDVKLTEILIEKGLRATVALGSLVTGMKYVELDFHPDAPPQQIAYGGDYPVFPTNPAPLEETTKSISQILKDIKKIRFEQIGDELHQTVQAARKTLEQTELMFSKVNEKTVPSIDDAIKQLNETMVDIEHVFGSDSALSYDLNKVLDELAVTIRAWRELTESVERDPQSLLFGRKDKGDQE
jgi:paraquat-inducible protein B